MKKSDIIQTACFFVLGMSFSNGVSYLFLHDTFPEIIEVPVEKTVIVPSEPQIIETQVIVYKDKEIPVEAEKEAYIYTRDWRQWESLAQFTAWAEDKITYLLEGDCDDYAENLQLCALEDGYAVSCQMIYNGKIQGFEVSPVKGSHMGNLVMIGNNIYYVEPVPEYFRIVWLCERD